MLPQRKLLIYFLIFSLFMQSASPIAMADGFDDVIGIFGWAHGPFESQRGQRPRSGQDTAIEQLAREIDWLEHHIDAYGTVVAKHPDVWGESRLMRHRYEYEEQMAAQLGQFDPTFQVALRRSDQSFLGMAFALDSQTGEGNVAAPTSTNSDNLNSLFLDLKFQDDTGSDSPLVRSAPLAPGADPKNALGFGFGTNSNLSLEPTRYLDQRSRYLNHLHELRRINEGDDTADSPGYSLNLVRIPVSVSPGKHTREGFGAEITVTADPYLCDELLPSTFRNMVISGLVNNVSLPMTKVVNDADSKIEAYLQTIAVAHNLLETGMDPSEIPKYLPSVFFRESDPNTIPLDKIYGLSEIQAKVALDGNYSPGWQSALCTYTQLSAEEKLQILGSLEKQSGIASVPAARNQRSRAAFPTTQAFSVLGIDLLAHPAADILAGFPHLSDEGGYLHISDVQGFLNQEFNAAYDYLSADRGGRDMWEHCNGLANAIRRRDIEEIKRRREYFMLTAEVEIIPEVNQADTLSNTSQHRSLSHGYNSGGAAELLAPPEDTQGIVAETAAWQMEVKYPLTTANTTIALAWAIIVESALLDERLTHDVREATASAGSYSATHEIWPFYGDNPSPQARQTFNDYVRCRWPVHVFALDPVVDEQNIADAHSRRRELQVAVALAFASGEIGTRTMMNFARRIEADMATIGLNPTSVGFSHGEDTFGWRFYPRFQTPPDPGNARAFMETMLGGPSREHELSQRMLEPGTRECVAIVMMPSFVPYCTFDTRTNWFRLTNPHRTELGMEDTMELSRAIQSMKNSAAVCSQCQHLYREGEVNRLMRRVDQLDRELPLQTMMVQIPYENTLGGFEMFNSGITDLAPELTGFYGAHKIKSNESTTLFLAGKGFSVHDTRVIAGGHVVKSNIISRELIQATIPAGVEILPADHRDRRFIDVHLATPYGVTSHLLIPAEEGEDEITAAPTPELMIWEEMKAKSSYAVVEGVVNLGTFDLGLIHSQISVLSSDPLVPLKNELDLTVSLILESDENSLLGRVSGIKAVRNLQTGHYTIDAENLHNLFGGEESSIAKLLHLFIQTQLARNPELGDIVVKLHASFSPSEGEVIEIGGENVSVRLKKDAPDDASEELTTEVEIEVE